MLQASLGDMWNCRHVIPDAVATLGGAGDTPRSICAPWLAAAASRQQLSLHLEISWGSGAEAAPVPQLPSAHARCRGAVRERQGLLHLGQVLHGTQARFPISLFPHQGSRCPWRPVGRTDLAQSVLPTYLRRQPWSRLCPSRLQHGTVLFAWQRLSQARSPSQHCPGLLIPCAACTPVIEAA